MLIAYDGNNIQGITGYREDYTTGMIDALHPIEGYEYIRIYEAETIDRVRMALDTGGTVRIEFDDDSEPIIITENGDLEPPTDEPPEPEPTPIDLLQQENAELWHDGMMKDLAIGSAMEETAELWHENMLLDTKLNDETAALWYELMTGGIDA